MSAEANGTDPGDDELPDPEVERKWFAERLREVGVSTQRFIDVHDGAKGTRNHTQHEPDAGELSGNYGVYGGPGGDSDVVADPEEFKGDPAEVDVLWLVDVDVDDYENDGDEPTAGLESLPETFTIESPHTDGTTGGHRYYAVRGHIAAAFVDAYGKANPSPEWGEVRVYNQMCVGPGSQISPGGCVHEWCDACKGCDKEWCDECAKPDGGFYRIAENREIAVLELETFVEAILRDLDGGDTDADADTDATEAVVGSPDTTGVPPYEPDPDAKPEDVRSRKPWMGTYLAAGHEAAGLDDRSTPDWRICKDMMKAGVAKDDVRDLLESGEYTKAYERKGDDYFENTWSDAYDDLVKECRKEGKPVPWTNHDGADAGSDADTDTDIQWFDVKQCFDSSTPGSTTRGYALAAQLLDTTHAFVAIRESGELYYFDPDLGYFVRKGETFVDELLERNMAGYMNSERRTNIYEIIVTRNYVSMDEFTPPRGKVCVKNGVLDLDTRDLNPHSPEYYFTNRLQTPYDPDAEAELWAEFLRESVSEGTMRKLEEFIGYTLEGWHHNREKNLFVVGPRQSGKSTFADTVQALFGDMPTVSNLTPQQIADTQFDAASLKDAALNAVNDINATQIKDSGTLKRVFSGERMKLERKYQDATFGEPKAKHLFTANWLPIVVGRDESLYRRVLIAEFLNSLSDDEKDRNLKRKLRDELPGILNRALDARDRLHEHDRFTNDRNTTATRQKWDSWLNSYKCFLYTQFHVTGAEDDAVGKKTFYRAYKEFAGRKGYTMAPQQAVTKSLKNVPEIEVTDDMYHGITWRDEDAAETTGPGSDDDDRDGGQQQASLDTTITDDLDDGSDDDEDDDGADEDQNEDVPQDELTAKIRSWVIDGSDIDHGADRETVLDTAEEHGLDRERVVDRIETLMNQGALYSPSHGTLRICP